MLKKYGILCIIILTILIPINSIYSNENNEIYIITIEKGDELYTKWGHNAIRVKNIKSNSDKLYNYGTFGFSPTFVKDFAQGNLIYWLSVANYNTAIKYYIKKNRALFSQKLNLSNEQSNALISLLKENAKPQNREYRYSHLDNNCSTKVRDIINNVLNNQIKKQTNNKISSLTARHYMTKPIDNNPALTFLFDFLLNASVDNNLSLYEEMFIPIKLKEYFDNITIVNDKGEKIKLVSEEKTIFRASQKVSEPFYSNIGFLIVVFLLTSIFSGIIFPLFTIDKAKRTHNLSIAITLFIFGFIFTALSILLVYTNLFTEHISFYDNESHFAIFITDCLLIIAAFTIKKNKALTVKLLKLWSYSKLIIIALYFVLYFFGVFNQDKIYIFIIVSIFAFLVGFLAQIINLTYKEKEISK